MIQKDQTYQNDENSNSIIMNQITYDLINTSGEDFVRVYYINQSIKRLHIFGEVFSEHGFLQRSDRRFKKDIETISNALERVLKLTGKSFIYSNNNDTSSKSRRYGFIAQEMKEIIPEVVREDEDGHLSIDVIGLMPFIVESLKELQSQLKDVEMKTSAIKRFEETIDQSIKEIEQKPVERWSLGPPLYCGCLGLTFGTLSLLIAINGMFPFVWAGLMVCCLSFWVSCFLRKNGKFDQKCFVAHVILLHILLFVVSITFVIGPMLQVFICIYSAILILSFGSYQWFHSGAKITSVVSLILSCLAFYAVLAYAPNMFCSVDTTMIPFCDLRDDMFLYKDPNEIKFKLSSEIPWNCFEPKLVVNGKHFQFETIDGTTVRAVTTDNSFEDIVDVSMECSNIPYKCNRLYLGKKDAVFERQKKHK